ncbi:alpha/beta hydrolase [Streptomyces sp. R-07]|uniref:alpha/beta hydrolase n=1 Tax=unclassified Streptomyces TaxID=2593676 RepID=UPI0034382734
MRPSPTTPLPVAFPAPDGVTLRGSLHLPEGAAPHPAITMAHGYGAAGEHGLVPFAEAFTRAGFAVLIHDHRGFGSSDGTPRHDIDPWQQIEDWRRAVTFLRSRPEIDADRIGLWGTSYAGGHALVLGATDRRLKAVVAQVPIVSGPEQARRRVAPENTSALEAMLDDDEQAQLHGEPPRTMALVSADPSVPAAYRTQDAIDFYLQALAEGTDWDNFVTVRSTRKSRMYEPGAFIDRISPTPLLMVVAQNDTTTLADTELAAYNRALEPKQLVLVPGGHFDPYVRQFTRASEAATEFFRTHLASTGD